MQPQQSQPQPQTQPTPKKSHKVVIVLIIFLFAIATITGVAIVMLNNKPQEPVAEQPAKEEEKPGEVTGFDPGHPLPDNEELDADNTDKYTDILKLYIKLNEEMTSDELKTTAEAEIPECTITLGRDFGKIYSPNSTDVISFDYSPSTKQTSFFNFSHALGSDQNVVRIVKLDDGKYEFGNDALIGTYSNKNRAINAYLYYLDQYEKYGKKEESKTDDAE